MNIRALIAIFIMINLSSCAYNSTAPSDESMGFSSGRTKPVTGISYVNLTGRLLSPLRRPIQNAEITIGNERSEETVTTDFDGRFILTFVAKSGEKINVKVANGARTYKESFILDDQDVRHGLATIAIQGNDTLKISDLKWYH